MREAGARRQGRVTAKMGQEAARQEAPLPLTGRGIHHIEAAVFQSGEAAGQGEVPIPKTDRPGEGTIPAISGKTLTATEACLAAYGRFWWGWWWSLAP